MLPRVMCGGTCCGADVACGVWRVALGSPAEYAICELSYSAGIRVHKTQGQAEFLVGWNSYGAGWRSGLGINPALRGGDCGSVAHTTAKRPQHAPNPRSGQRQPTKPAWVMAEGSVVKLARDGVQRVCKEGVRDRIMVHLCHSAGMSGSEVRALKLSDFLLHADVGSGLRVQVKGRVVGRRKDVELCVVGALALHLYFTDSQGDKVFGSPLEGKPAISPGKTFNGSYLNRPEQVLATSEEGNIQVPAEILDAVFPGRKEGLLHGLCSVLVQDAAVLRRKYPRHALFTPGAISDPAFEAFARRLTAQSSVQGTRLVAFPETSLRLTAREDGLPSLKQEMDRLRRER
ncbi:hypothetical protein PaG_00585 [Moesziomyces aphidis]|uniref:Uncharacterized protein n=1 Tax=Moesziomyces aphidis TaxID=84754 RepID=W3VT14_MOEAP|nr:hypothetical protein PaG_00585 [Moesziomyces aphidis]